MKGAVSKIQRWGGTVVLVIPMDVVKDSTFPFVVNERVRIVIANEHMEIRKVQLEPTQEQTTSEVIV